MLLTELDLVGLFHFLELCNSVSGRELELFKSQVLLDYLLHLSLYLLQFFGSEGLFEVEVVVESVVDSRTNSQLSTGVESLYSLSEDVGSGMPEGLFAVECIEGADLKLAVAVDDSADVLYFAVYLYAAGSLVKTHSYALDDLCGRLCGLYLTHAAVF